MGKNKKGFNWKARNPVETIVDNSTTSKINVELNGVRVDEYDQCNPLVLPSKKRKTKKKKDAIKVTKILSKKQRKILEKIVDKKKKKENRADLIAALSKVQTTPEVLSQLTSITEVQTKGVKRYLNEDKRSLACNVNESRQEEKVNSISGSRKRRKLLSLLQEPNTEKETDPNVVGFQDSSDEGEDSSDNEDDGSISGQNITDDPKNTSIDGGQSNIECTISENKILQETAEENCHENDFENKKLKCTDKEIKICRNSKSQMKVPAIFVPVQRNPKIQENRLKLPVLAEEQIIMEAIKENPVIVVAGETGSGKTTQVPQFLYEAGYALNGKLIGITEPRRIAAISMSKRIAEEMNLTSREVSYLIRFEGNTTEDTKLKFMTDGVLLKEIQTDFLLNKYSVIILDEAHERSVYTDILIGLLSRIVPLRNKKGDPLKLIIMSATLRLEDFTENSRLFRESPPVIKVDSRQFPVTIHFNKNTWPNYLREAYKKVCKIHTQLPDGGILVFLTGQKEVNSLVRKLRKTFPYKPKAFTKTDETSKNTEENHIEDCEDLDLKQVIQRVKKANKEKSIILPDIDLDKYSSLPVDDTEGDLLAEEELLEEDDDELGLFDGTPVTSGQPLWVLPLFSVLSNREQAKVFEPPPSGCRLCVVATNVAETSLTIPHIKYVVDSGKVKTKMYDKVTGVSAFTITWTSKAAANQRAGRAGRMGPGHCYRLYSSAVFNDNFEEYSAPEIQRKPVDDLVLQMKAMGINKVQNFPFPSAPDVLQLRAAERRLFLLGALEEKDPNKECSMHITDLGRTVSELPVAPRFGKILALGHQYGLLPYAVCLVAALSVQEVLLDEPVGNIADGKLARQKCQQLRRSWAGVNNSLLLGDPMVLLRAVGAAEYAGHKNELEKFCQDNGLRHKAVIEVRKLRLQLTSQLQLALPGLELAVDPAMPPPSDSQSRHLRQLLLAGFPDQVAHKVDPDEIKDDADKLKWKHAYRCAEMEDPVIMHSSSVLRRKYPEWVIYQEVYETNKLYMRGITAIEPEWLPSYAPALCNLSQPMTDPPPSYDTASGKVFCHVSGTFGRAGWQLPIVQIEFPAGVGKYRWFARFLLDGSVCPKLARYTKSLLSTPASMVKSWAHLQERTDILLNALMSNQVDCREKLYSSWKDNPTYLLSAYQKWLPESAHNDVAISWPPL